MKFIELVRNNDLTIFLNLADIKRIVQHGADYNFFLFNGDKYTFTQSVYDLDPRGFSDFLEDEKKVVYKFL